jgi:hypothetical protein
MPDVFPDSASVDGGQLALGGIPAAELAEEHVTRLVVLCE